MIRVLLVDDEEMARERLRHLLSAIDDVVVVGEAADGNAAAEQIAHTGPELVFLDIQMPGRTGLDVAAGLSPPRPRVIFCTAYDQYAIDAFNHHAVDYLLKPVSRSRLAEAVARVREPLSKQERWCAEAGEAAAVQNRMFPPTPPRSQGLDYAGTCRQALGTGGDYYDFIPMGAGRVGLALGDVSGKGMAAALLMAGIQARLQSLAPLYGTRVGELAAHINAAMCTPENTKYVTLFYGIYDEARRVLSYVNAGHLPPIVLRGGSESEGCLRLQEGGTFLGVFREAEYGSGEVQLGPGDILVLYSDGITETTAPGGDTEFGEELLCDVIRRNRSLAAAPLCERIIEAVESFSGGAPPSDDRSLVVAKFLPEGQCP